MQRTILTAIVFVGILTTAHVQTTVNTGTDPLGVPTSTLSSMSSFSTGTSATSAFSATRSPHHLSTCDPHDRWRLREHHLDRRLFTRRVLTHHLQSIKDRWLCG